MNLAGFLFVNGVLDAKTRRGIVLRTVHLFPLRTSATLRLCVIDYEKVRRQVWEVTPVGPSSSNSPSK